VNRTFEVLLLIILVRHRRSIDSMVMNRLFDYLVAPALILFAAAHAAFWWTDSFQKQNIWESLFHPVRVPGLPTGLFSLLLLMAFVYENGYKKYYRFGNKPYFYIVHVAPLCVAVGGLVYGLRIVYV
jgi:hypothetical protein